MIISAGTRALIPDFACRELDLVRVKGKREPIAIFEPIGPAESLDAAQKASLAAFSDVVTAYREQKWDAAQSSLIKLKGEQDTTLYNVYLDRIGRFRKEPPASDWDGVFEHQTK